MIAKKSSKADLERKRFAFFQIGLVVSGSLVLAAFEYSHALTEKKQVVLNEDKGIGWSYTELVFEEEEVKERPEPKQQMSVQTEPIDNVTISSKPVVAITSTAVGQQIIVDDPCTDCYVIGDPDLGEEPIIDVAEVDPSFVGGEEAMIRWIQSKVEYPVMCFETGVQGTVYVEFVVNTDGSISNVVTKNEVHKDLAKEAERVISMMPNWTPGEQAGKKVRVRYVVPINFVIR